MLLSTISNIKKIYVLGENFKSASEFISSNNLNEMECGHYQIVGEDVFVNIINTKQKSKEDAKLETHNVYADIQIPLTSSEVMGYTPREVLPNTDYNEKDDISFYDGEAQSYFTLHPGEFVVFMPEDAHAPAITPIVEKKAIIKVKIN